MFVSDFINGPMIWISFLFFLGGTLYQIVTFYFLSKSIVRPTPHQQRIVLGETENLSLLDRTSLEYRFAMFRLTVFGRHPGMMITTMIFHSTLILTPFFVLGHNILLDFWVGSSFPSLPEIATDFLSVVLLLCCSIFILRRLFVPKVRAITTGSDFLILLITAAPFLTGFLSYHHIGNYDTMVLVHMASGEIMIMAMPFSKFIHMIYFFINRFILIHQNTLGKGGSRVWQ